MDVDDIINIALDLEDNLERIIKVPVTVMNAVADKAILMDPGIKCSDILADDKMQAEGTAEEEKIYLCWILNTRSLQVKLPSHKDIAWSSQIDQVLNNKTVSKKTLQSILGRLDIVAQVLTPLGHFFCNIRQVQMIAESKGHNVRLSTRTKKDLELTIIFLENC